MSSSVCLRVRQNLRLDLQHAELKRQMHDEESDETHQQEVDQSPHQPPQPNFYKPPSPGTSNTSGSLSPNLQPATPITYPEPCSPEEVYKLGDKYLLLAYLEGSPLRRCINLVTKEEFVCKVVPNFRYRQTLLGHLRLDLNPFVNSVEEVIVGPKNAYLIFPKCYGDLHSYVRQKRCLRESEAMALFQQVVRAVTACHDAGIVLRDLKLRKFVFKDPERTQLKLETLDDSVLLEEDDDWLNDKHGCPAYVSPEILTTASSYSGKAADCWSLGVMLYTMLIGRYPFHDNEPSGLFSKIRRGCYHIPEVLSPRARCLIRSLLRMDPKERLSAEEVLNHPWFKISQSRNFSALDLTAYGIADDANVPDQTVPDTDVEEDNPSLFI